MLEETSASTCSENSGPRLRGSSGFRSGTKASQGVQDQVSKSNKSLVWPTCLRALPKVVPQTSFLRSEEHTSELQSRLHLVCRLLLEKKTNMSTMTRYTRRYAVVTSP